jgi:hypothetical protein
LNDLEILLLIIGINLCSNSILYAAIRFFANKIADRLFAKYELKLNKDLEKFKSGLEGTQYISKTRFDAEFTIYRELSKTYFYMVLGIVELRRNHIAIVCTDLDNFENTKTREEMFATVRNKCRDAQDTLYENAPFISIDLYEPFKELMLRCFDEVELPMLANSLDEVSKLMMGECEKRAKAIEEKWEKLCGDIREHLDELTKLKLLP